MVGVQLFSALKWNTAALQSWSSTLLYIPAISFSHSITIFQTNVSLQLLVLDLSAELGTLGPHALQVSCCVVHGLLQCLQLQGVEMEQENNAGGDYQHCINIGDNTWCVSTVSVSVNSCSWF